MLGDIQRTRLQTNRFFCWCGSHQHPSQHDVQALLVMRQERMILTRMSRDFCSNRTKQTWHFFKGVIYFFLETWTCWCSKIQLDIGGLMFLALDLDRIDLESVFQLGGGNCCWWTIFCRSKVQCPAVACPTPPETTRLTPEPCFFDPQWASREVSADFSRFGWWKSGEFLSLR